MKKSGSPAAAADSLESVSYLHLMKENGGRERFNVIV